MHVGDGKCVLGNGWPQKHERKYCTGAEAECRACGQGLVAELTAESKPGGRQGNPGSR